MSTLSRYLLLRTTSRVLILLVVFLILAAGGQLAIAVGRGVPILTLLPTLPSILMLALPIAIPLALASGVLITISAMQRDGEFRALAASGLRTAECLARLWPLVAVSVIATTILTHVLLPQAMLGLRTNQERYAQAALAHQVNAGRPLYSEGGSQAFALHAAGHTLSHVFLSQTTEEATIALYARGANWFLAAGEQGSGLGLELEDVRILRREADGRVNLVTTPSAQFPLDESIDDDIDVRSPDTWSTARLLAYISAWDGSGRRRDYNNVLLSLHFRLFIPISLVAFVLFAAGLGLRRGSSESLIAVIIVVLVVALSTTPALFYVKSAVDHAIISPAWLLWPQALVLGALGLRWIAKPNLLGETTIAPGWWTHLWGRLSGRVASIVRRRIGGREEGMAASPQRAWLSVLSRFMIRQGVSTWLAVLFIGTFLVVMGQFLNRLGLYVRAVAMKPMELLTFFAASLPEFIALWLPLSVGAAALLVAAPLLRRGNLMALSASGIPLRRVFTPFLLIALVACAAKAVLDDQVVTRLSPVVAAHEAAMKERRSHGRPQPAGWRSEGAFWLSHRAQPAAGTYDTVAAFRGSPEHGSALLAAGLRHDPERAWVLTDVLEVAPDGRRRAFAEMSVDELGWGPLPSPEQLSLTLLPDRIKTSDQLLRSDSPLADKFLVARGLTALTPLFALLLALPGFVRFENRHRLATALVGSALLLAVPLVVVAVANRAILSNQGQPLITAGITAIALLAVGGWRWWHMRP